jgi:hypothetical protein
MMPGASKSPHRTEKAPDGSMRVVDTKIINPPKYDYDHLYPNRCRETGGPFRLWAITNSVRGYSAAAWLSRIQRHTERLGIPGGAPIQFIRSASERTYTSEVLATRPRGGHFGVDLSMGAGVARGFPVALASPFFPVDR